MRQSRAQRRQQCPTNVIHLPVGAGETGAQAALAHSARSIIVTVAVARQKSQGSDRAELRCASAAGLPRQLACRQEEQEMRSLSARYVGPIGEARDSAPFKQFVGAQAKCLCDPSWPAKGGGVVLVAAPLVSSNSI